MIKPTIKHTWTIDYGNGDIRTAITRGLKIVITREMLFTFLDVAYKTSVIFTKKREFQKSVKDAGLIPSFYGYAYYDFACDTYIYLPIPLNYLTVVYNWIRYWIKFGLLRGLILPERMLASISRLHKETQDLTSENSEIKKNEYQRGLRDGFNNGYVQGSADENVRFHNSLNKLEEQLKSKNASQT